MAPWARWDYMLPTRPMETLIQALYGIIGGRGATPKIPPGPKVLLPV